MADKKISELTSASTPLAGTEVLPIVQSGATKKVTVANLTAGRAVSMLSGTITDNIASPVPLNINNNSASTAAGTRVNWQFNGITVGYVGNQFDGADFSNLYNTNRFHIFTIGGVEYFRIVNSDVTVKSGNLVIGTSGKGVNFTANTPAAGMTSQLLNWYEEGTFTPTIVDGGFSALSSASAKYTRIGRVVYIVLDGSLTGTGNGNQLKIGGLPFTVSTGGWAAAALYAEKINTDNYNLAGVFVSGTTQVSALINVAGTQRFAYGNDFSAGPFNITGFYHI